MTFLSPGVPLAAGLATDERVEEFAGELREGASPLDDFEPITPAQPGLLSDIVLEGRR